MTFPAQNLHGFVLDLLGNEAARSAFGADPTQALSDAGLQDITAQDVQEILPLVLDYAPDVPVLDGVGAMQAMSAVQQLQSLARAADASSQGVTGSFGGESPLGDFVAAGTGSIDGGQFAATYEGARFDAAGNTAFSADGVAGSVTAGSAGLGSFSAGGNGATDGASFGGAFAGGPLGTSGQGTVATNGGEFTGALSSDSPLGESGLSFTGSGGDLGSRLESAGDDFNFGDAKGAAAASTVAGYVSSGGDAFGQLLSSGVPEGPMAGTPLGSLADTAGAAADNIARQMPQNAGGDAQTGGSASGSASADQDARADALGQAPVDVPLDLPTGLPTDLPLDLPAGVPTDLPTDLGGGAAQDVASELTQNVPDDLPSDLPDLPVANPLPEDNAAPEGRAEAQADAQASGTSSGSGDLASDSPLGQAGQVGDTAGDLLSSPSSAVDDLPF